MPTWNNCLQSTRSENAQTHTSFVLSGNNPKFPPCTHKDGISSAYLCTAAPVWLPVLYPGIVWLFTSFTNKPVHTDLPYFSASHNLTRCNSCEHFPKVTNDQLTLCSVYIRPVCKLYMPGTKLEMSSWYIKPKPICMTALVYFRISVKMAFVWYRALSVKQDFISIYFRASFCVVFNDCSLLLTGDPQLHDKRVWNQGWKQRDVWCSRVRGVAQSHSHTHTYALVLLKFLKLFIIHLKEGKSISLINSSLTVWMNLTFAKKEKGKKEVIVKLLFVGKVH